MTDLLSLVMRPGKLVPPGWQAPVSDTGVNKFVVCAPGCIVAFSVTSLWRLSEDAHCRCAGAVLPVSPQARNLKK